MAYIDTAFGPERDQRPTPIELIGQVIGTSGTVPYVHLQLEMSRRLFGDTMPTLVANDGVGPDSERLAALAQSYGAEYVDWPALGHSTGDLRIFRESMSWAKRLGLDVVVKFSRRFVPLVSWRHGLQYLAAFNTDAAFFTRRHMDAPGGLFRTDAIAYRLRLIDNERVRGILDETIENGKPANVENMFESFSRVCGGWVMWDLLGPDFYKPWNKAMQWRGLTPFHYGDLARVLDLPYTDFDFLPASAIKLEAEPVDDRPRGAQFAKVLQTEPGALQPANNPNASPAV